MQTQAARIVTGTTELVFIEFLRSETGWEILAACKNKHKFLFK